MEYLKTFTLQSFAAKKCPYSWMATKTPTKTMKAIIENKKSILLIVFNNYEGIIKIEGIKGSNKNKELPYNQLSEVIKLSQLENFHR